MGGYFSTILTYTDTAFLKSHTKFSESALKEWYAKFLRECPDGKMNRRKLVKYYRELFPEGDIASYNGYVITLCDVNRNGYIDFKEFLQMTNLASDSPVEDKLRWAFRLSDTDGNGRIDFEEMKILVQAFRGIDDGLEWTPEMIESRTKEIFTAMDTNHDGYINEREFMVGCMNDKDIANLVLSPRSPEYARI